jgi:dUTP pyrophosphatase
MSNILRVKKLSDDAVLPKKGSLSSAGYDLYASKTVIILPHSLEHIPLDIAMAVPDGYYGRIADRSSFAMKQLTVGGGVVDSDYRGHVQILMNNHSDQSHTIEKHTRCAQLIIEKIANPTIIEVDNLDQTGRENGGFGSTGKG